MQVVKSLEISSVETKPSDDEVLTMRLVDRVLRPLFPEDFHAEVQVMISLFLMIKK